MRRLLAFALALAAFIVFSPEIAGAAPIKFARHPHVSNGRMAFAYHGDIWVANADGTSPVRLTAHPSRNTFPRFSPDGRWIAFTSNRMGNNDVWVIPAAGGEARQLTFLSTNDSVLYWTPDSRRILFSTSRGAHAFGSPIFSVALEGGLPEPLGVDTASAGMMKQDGSLFAFNRIAVRYWRKGYKGNAADNIWLQDLRTKTFTQLTNTSLEGFREHRQNLYPMWGADGMIYFASERGGLFNLWKIAPTGGDPVQVTSHKADGVQFPSISPDGRTISYENEFEVWTLAVPGGTPRKVTVDLAFDPKDNLTQYLQSKGKADGFAPSPEGDYIAADFHGEIFLVPTDPEVGEKRQVTASSWRQTGAVVAPDGRAIAYLSDESREQEIWVWDREAGSTKKLSGHPSFKTIGAWSPDARQLAYVAANRLFVADVETARSTELAYNEAGGYDVTGYSPDGKWLVYTRRDADMNGEVYLFDVAGKKEHNVTSNPFADSRATLTPDASRLVFVSNRDGGAPQLFVVSLTRVTEDPEDPLVRERQRKAKPEKPEKKAEDAAPPALTLDVAGIDRRAVQLTRGEPVSAYFLSADGRLVYFVSSDEKGRGLFSIGLDGRDRKRVVDGAFTGLRATADAKKIFYTQDGDIYQMELSGEKKKTKIPVNVTVMVDQRVEWRQIFDESWRVMKYRFYDEKMHGVDWAAIKAGYEPLLEYVGENDDVYDLVNEMIGELNASHTGVSGPPSRQIPPAYTTRLPGFELEPANGAYRISHVYRNGPADKEWLGLKVGDYVVAIDGRPVKAGDNYWQPLNHALNEYVTFTVAPTPAADKSARDVRIRTVTSLAAVKYEEWVDRNRAFVDKESNGQIAYVHIQSMNQPSLRKFQDEIDQFWNKKGLVVDIRYNGGGNIDQELIDILERRPYEFWNSRWGARTWGRRPRQMIVGPKVMLINWRSASDSEVTPMAFRQLGRGRIVGNPTNASVIATGSYGLINGGSIRTPGSLVVTWDPTRPNNYGVNLENYGVEPDVFVKNTPDDELKGYDRELKTAVDEALRMLKEKRWQY
ncbi:MAG TPA: S41 family peptidase [Vicinamibacterales bacterium]|nr:S41 family peptidase [Vicinamibacterales bacterium]